MGMNAQYSVNVTPGFETAIEHLLQRGRLDENEIRTHVIQACKKLRISPTQRDDVTVAEQSAATRTRIYRLGFEIPCAGQPKKVALFFYVVRKNKEVFLIHIKVQDEPQAPPREPVFPRSSSAAGVSEKDLIAHMAAVWQHFERCYIDNPILVEPSLRPLVKLNKRFLVEAVKHSRIDIMRMARWHLPRADQDPDHHKFAGFVSKWVAQLRPIYVDAEIPVRSSLLVINARFALWTFRSFLARSVPANLVSNLIYLFHFRQEKGETLSLVAYCCEEISHLSTP